MIEALLQSEIPGDRVFQRRLVIVVRADPVICGHSGEARNLAEVALQRGFTDVRIITWPLDLLATSGLPLKPLEYHGTVSSWQNSTFPGDTAFVVELPAGPLPGTGVQRHANAG